MAEGLGARRAAVGLITAVMADRQPLSQLTEGTGPLEGLSPGDRARAQRLALSVLRQVEPLDRLLAPLLRKPPPLPVMNILRLAATEILEGAAAHGVVNAAVELTRRGKRSGHLAGLVNAVLRALPADARLIGPAQRLPRWIRQPLVHAHGREVVAAIEAVQAKAPPLDLTLRPGAPHPDGLMLPTGSLRLAEAGQVSALPGYQEGGWWVQDAAAALAVPLLGPVAGLRVLDMCAAPGGKTMQLAAAGWRVTALDASAKRLERMQANAIEAAEQCGILTVPEIAAPLTFGDLDDVMLDAAAGIRGIDLQMMTTALSGGRRGSPARCGVSRFASPTTILPRSCFFQSFILRVRSPPFLPKSPSATGRAVTRTALLRSSTPVTSVPQRRLPPSSRAYVLGVRLGGSGQGWRGSSRPSATRTLRTRSGWRVRAARTACRP